MSNMLNLFPSFSIIASHAMTITKTETVPRSLRERLFSFPWRPMQKTKIVYYEVPNPQVLVDYKRNIVYCHPSILAEAQKELSK